MLFSEFLHLQYLIRELIFFPFDETNSAGWEDVETGVNALVANDARIINMSLGAPGTVLSDDWSSILSGVVADPASEGAIFVKAAGNDHPRARAVAPHHGEPRGHQPLQDGEHEPHARAGNGLPRGTSEPLQHSRVNS